ncbi:hypothetical protein, partial [uncultured Hymenobacter sp.]|uniref:hypothetical protein n=1 Tax=uncultured Hymenobacter sp. TaxID=170016 RepID=UPI0035CAF90C
HIEQALGFNLLATVATPILVVGAVEELRGWLTKYPRRSSFLYRPWFGWSVVTFTFLFTVLRNLPGPLGTWLAP